MSTKDYHDHDLSGATAQAVQHFENGCHQLRCFIGDPLAEAQAALQQSPGMSMAHVLVAYLNLLGTEAPALPAGRAQGHWQQSFQAARPRSIQRRQTGTVHATGTAHGASWPPCR